MRLFYNTNKLYIGLFLLVLLILAEIVIAFQNDRTFLDSEKRINHTYEVLEESSLFLSTIQRIQSNGQAYVITGKESFLTPFYKDITTAYSYIDKLSTLTKDNPSQHVRVDSLYDLTKDRIDFSVSYIRLRTEKGLAAAAGLISTGKGNEMTRQIADVLQDMKDEEELVLNRHKAVNTNSTRNFKSYFYILCFTFVLVVVGIYKLIKKNDVLQKKIIEKSREVENKAIKFEALLENSFEGIVLLDKNFNYSYIGSSARKITGFPMEERTPERAIENIHPGDRKKFRETLNKVMLTDGESEQVLYRSLHKEGHYLWVEAVITNRLRDKNVEAIVFNIRDVSHKVALDEQKDDFLNMVSHELKTPVTSLKALAQILHQQFIAKKDEANSLLLSKMVAQTNRLIRLIRDLLDVDKIGDSKLQFNETVFLIDKLVHEVIEEVQRLSSSHRIVSSFLAKVEVYGDKERTSQVLTNLLVNAIKYSPGANQVIVKVKEEKGVVVCSVEDFGMGITEEEHNKVFEKFYRSKRENLNTFPGLGMGLYISSEIIKRQNGKMWLESERGKGSIFYFSLPVAVEERVNVPVI